MDDEWDDDDFATAIAELCEPTGASTGLDALEPCDACAGTGMREGRRRRHEASLCTTCGGVGWWGIPSERPTAAPPGSTDKVAVMAQRYRDGLPLWDPCDATHERKPK